MPVLQADHEVTGAALPLLDITDFEAIRRAVRDAAPDLVIHAAAFTAVDECERRPDVAFRVNALGTRNVALAAREARARLAYISTDYVFDGTKGSAYTEFDEPNPTGIYSRSKWAGEQYVRQFVPESYVIRSAWLCGAGGACAPDTIRRLIRENGQVDGVDDQIGKQPWAGDQARAIALSAGKG